MSGRFTVFEPVHRSAGRGAQQRERDPEEHHQASGADQHTLIAVQQIQFAKERLRHPAGFGNKPASLNNLIDYCKVIPAVLPSSVEHAP